MEEVAEAKAHCKAATQGAVDNMQLWLMERTDTVEERLQNILAN